MVGGTVGSIRSLFKRCVEQETYKTADGSKWIKTTFKRFGIPYRISHYHAEDPFGYDPHGFWAPVGTKVKALRPIADFGRIIVDRGDTGVVTGNYKGSMGSFIRFDNGYGNDVMPGDVEVIND